MKVLYAGIVLLITSACTSMLFGGAGYQSGNDERSQSVAASDTAITSEIRNKLAADPLVGMFSIAVRTYSGAVTLSGAVSNDSAKEHAGKIARDADGVKSVHNQIKVE